MLLLFNASNFCSVCQVAIDNWNIYIANCPSKVLWVEFCPSKFLCWSPNLSVPPNVTLLKDRVFTEVIKLKWGHKVRPWSNEWYLYKKGTQTGLDVNRHREKMTIHKPRREAWDKSLPHSPHKESTLPTPWIWLSSLWNWEAIDFYCLSCLWYFVTAALTTNK